VTQNKNAAWQITISNQNMKWAWMYVLSVIFFFLHHRFVCLHFQ